MSLRMTARVWVNGFQSKDEKIQLTRQDLPAVKAVVQIQTTANALRLQPAVLLEIQHHQLAMVVNNLQVSFN